MKCAKCNAEIEENDTFCHACGDWTPRGFNYLKDENNLNAIKNSKTKKNENRLYTLLFVVSLSALLFVGMSFLRGDDLYKPVFFLKRQFDNIVYGYNTSIIKTDNKYINRTIETIDDAKEIIKKDLNEQKYKCSHDIKTKELEYDLEEDYGIISVNLCDVSYEEAEKIKDVIDKIYTLFPEIKGALTNVSITNSKDKDAFVAYFQPMYQFVNANTYNKVNKTQILLNSYYFLNENIMEKEISNVIKDNYYVKDATWESIIAHEFGHYISFFTYLKSNNLDNIIMITKENEKMINELVSEYDTGNYSKSLIDSAIYSYNAKYMENKTLESFAKSISNYAYQKKNNSDIIYDEVIAEAIHDYFLHGNNATKESMEMVNVIKNRLR